MYCNVEGGRLKKKSEKSETIPTGQRSQAKLHGGGMTSTPSITNDLNYQNWNQYYQDFHEDHIINICLDVDIS